MNIDEFYMKYAIKLAYRGKFTTTPNPIVGCVVVNFNKIVGEGWHERAGSQHAEIKALNMAGENAKGSTVYITLEPCNYFGKTPPCCDHLIKCGVSRVVIAIKDPNPKVYGKSIKKLKKYGIIITYGILLKKAKKINIDFIKRMKTGIPWIQLKLGSSLDGCIAMKNGSSKWITSLQSRQDVQYLRARSSAILSSSSTVIIDNPFLNFRWKDLDKNIKKYYTKDNVRQPIKVIIDSKNLISPEYNVINPLSKIILVRIKKDKLTWPKNVEQLIVPSLNNKINLLELFKILGKREINRILVEAGSILSGYLLKIGLIDEIIIYLSSKLLGSNTKQLFSLPNISHIDQALSLYFKKIKRIGPDIRITLKTKNSFNNI